MTGPRFERAVRRRGAFGLDERRRPDPARVEADLRGLLARVLPDVWPLPGAEASVEGSAGDSTGRTLALLLPRGHVAVLRIERDPDAPGPACRHIVERCRALHIPQATVSTLAEGRAALRRLGVEPPLPRAARATPTLRSVFGSA